MYFIRVTWMPAASAAGGVFPDSPQIPSGFGVIDVHRQHNGDGHREVDENVEGEKGVEPRTHAGDFFQKRKADVFELPGDAVRELEGPGRGPVEREFADKVGQPHSEDGERQPGDVLIGHEGDGEERVDQRGQDPAEEGGE